MSFRGTLADRFWAKVNKNGPIVRQDLDPCWTWMAFVDHGGYGRLADEHGRCIRAHRASWRIHHGEEAGELFVLHRCDNRRCVRPAHLFLGTSADNVADMIAKGRDVRVSQPGEKHGNARLTAADVASIVQLSRRGMRGVDLARRYGVHKATVSDILRGRKWAHATGIEQADAALEAGR